MKFSVLLVVAAAALAGVASSGCSQQTLDSATRDVAHDASIVHREALRAEKKARPDLQKLQLGGRVTAALRANQNLPGGIRVDADLDGVRLRGTVDTKHQRDLAGRIARDTLDEKYKVENDLEVRSQ